MKKYRFFIFQRTFLRISYFFRKLLRNIFLQIMSKLMNTTIFEDIFATGRSLDPKTIEYVMRGMEAVKEKFEI